MKRIVLFKEFEFLFVIKIPFLLLTTYEISSKIITGLFLARDYLPHKDNPCK